MTKSELINEKSHQSVEIEEYLLKFISKSIEKTLLYSQNMQIPNLNRESESQKEQLL